MSIHYVSSVEDASLLELIVSIKDKKYPVIGIDTETSGLDCHKDTLILFQLKVGNEIYVLNCITLPKELIISLVKYLGIYNPLLIAHNAKFEVKFLYAFTGMLLTNIHDTQTTESMLNAGIESNLSSLKLLVDRYCGVVLEKETRLEFYNNTSGKITEQQIIYSANDVLYLEDIYNKQMKKVSEIKEERTYQIEFDVLPVVAMMEYIGIYLNQDVWKGLIDKAIVSKDAKGKEIISDLLTKIKKKAKFGNALELADSLLITEGTKTKRDRKALEAITDTDYVWDWVSKSFNMSSHTQLLNALHLTGVKVESTNEKILQKDKDKYPIIPKIFEYREFDKRATSYGQGILDLVNPITNSLHTEYFNIGAPTGRFSSSKPNLQSIPRDNEYRAAFQARKGYSFISCDYNQQEYRLAGAISGEPEIINAYLAGKDMHTKTGALLNKVDINNVTKQQRTDAKTVNFAMIYWTSVWGLKFTLNSSLEEAQRVYDEFTNGYPVFTLFRDTVGEKIWDLGYSVTLTGRRRFAPPKPKFGDSKDITKFKAKVMRELFNHCIQGTGADTTKMAMSKIFKENPFGNSLRILLTLHDEVLVEVRDEIVPEATKFIENCMLYVEQPFLGSIPAAVESHSGKVWQK